MSTVIKPTPGRVVWYSPGSTERMAQQGSDPLAAHIVAVLPDGRINLVVFDALGGHNVRWEVRLLQEGEKATEAALVGHAEWMPYQVGQAAALLKK